MFGTQGIRFNQVDSPVLSFFLFSVRRISFSSGGSAVAELEKKHLEEKVADLEARLAKAEDKAETAETREREANARVFALIEDKRPKSLMQRLLGK